MSSKFTGLPLFLGVDYDALRALDAGTNAAAPSMTEEEIDALPVCEYKLRPDDGSAGSQRYAGLISCCKSLTKGHPFPAIICLLNLKSSVV